MLSTLAGITNFSMERHDEKAYDPMVCTSSPNSRVPMRRQLSAKALLPIVISFLGNTRVPEKSQPWKAPSPMMDRLDGSSNSPFRGEPVNTLFCMAVMPS